eukprot:SAG11_NODE_9424_length_913_cov_1.007371_2_plen_228_part_01
MLSICLAALHSVASKMTSLMSSVSSDCFNHHEAFTIVDSEAKLGNSYGFAAANCAIAWATVLACVAIIVLFKRRVQILPEEIYAPSSTLQLEGREEVSHRAIQDRSRNPKQLGLVSTLESQSHGVTSFADFAAMHRRGRSDRGGRPREERRDDSVVGGTSEKQRDDETSTTNSEGDVRGGDPKGTARRMQAAQRRERGVRALLELPGLVELRERQQNMHQQNIRERDR